MDKQDLRYSYLGYFAGQYAKKEDIDFDTLENMAAGDNDLEREVLKELIDEGLIEGVEIFEDEHFSTITQHNGKLKLTTKGIKEILNLFPEEKKEIIDDIKSDIENQKHKILTLEDIINKENDRISKLSKKEKIKEIKEKILLLFWAYKINIHKYSEGKVLHSEIKSKIRKIVQHYYDGAISTLSKEAINELRLEGYVQYKYEDKNAEIQIDTLLTTKGIAHIKNEKAKKESELNEYVEKNNIKISNEILKIQNILADIYSKTNTTQLQAVAEMMKNSDMQATMKVLENVPINHIMQSINKYYSPLYNESFLNNYNKLVNSINHSARAIEGIPNFNNKSLSNIVNESSSNLYEESENEINLENNIYTFEGILGKNCGEVEKYIDSSKQLQARKFVISRGIKVLRGYAPASKLYEASKVEYDYYQRKPYKEHLDSLEAFLLSMKDSAKYIPEITLVSRNPLNLEKFNLDIKALSPTNKGKIDNLNYYILQTSSNELLRIDGNHRLEAAYFIYKKYNKDLCFPFSIILWNPEDYIGDGSKIWKDMIDEERKENEAFLFYFLNSKAKKLEIEENLKGIIKADKNRWRDSDLNIADTSLAIMRNFYLQTINPSISFLNESLCGENGLLQISQILSKIMKTDQINQQEFDMVLKLTNSILEMDISGNLKNFDFYCQLIFYIAYKNKTKEKCIEKIKNLDNWVKKYNFTNETFNDPILLYQNAKQTNNLDPINIFVAMPYYDDSTINNINDQFNILKSELIQKYPTLENQLNIYEVMKHRGYAVDIQQQIIGQISSAQIFIADVSEHICKKGTKKVDCHANPNVMYELGIAQNQENTTIILLKNSNDEIDVPSDIITKYHNYFALSDLVGLRKKLFKAIEGILKDKFEIV